MQLACFSKAVNMSRTVENSEIQTALFSKRQAGYRAENTQTEKFLKPLVADQDKNSRGSFVLYFIFCDVTCNRRITLQNRQT